MTERSCKDRERGVGRQWDTKNASGGMDGSKEAKGVAETERGTQVGHEYRKGG